MFTLEEISEFDSDTVGDNFSGETKPMEQYLDTFETSLQSKTPYSDVTKVISHFKIMKFKFFCNQIHFAASGEMLNICILKFFLRYQLKLCVWYENYVIRRVDSYDKTGAFCYNLS